MSEVLLYVAPCPPFGYFELSLYDKINWQIENSFLQQISWVAKWLEVVDRGSCQILVTQQDDLRTAKRAFFDRILSFYGFDACYDLPNLPRTLDDTHFRRADPTEWRSAFTPNQVAKVTSMLPPTLMKRFCWEVSQPCISELSAADAAR